MINGGTTSCFSEPPPPPGSAPKAKATLFLGGEKKLSPGNNIMKIT